MATFTFDRPIIIRDKESKRKLEDVLYSDKPGRKLPSRAFSEAERKKGEELLARHYFRSDH